MFDIFGFVQQIDEMLAGSLSQEDEDAVLAELEAITQVRLRCQPACCSGSQLTIRMER